MAVDSQGAVPACDSVILLCPLGKQVIRMGVCIGITPDAIRIDEDGISVTWVEYFDEPPPSLQSAAAELKRSRMPSKTGIIARAQVNRVLEVAQKLKQTIAVSHTPVDCNDAHASITGYPENQPAKLAMTRAFQEFISNKDVPGFVA
jgi:hypothetical protein